MRGSVVARSVDRGVRPRDCGGHVFGVSATSLLHGWSGIGHVSTKPSVLSFITPYEV